MTTDRLTLARAFRAAGMAQDQADGVATAIYDAIYNNVATKSDLAEFRAAIKADLSELRVTSQAEVAALRSDLKAETAALRADLKAEIVTTKTDLRTQIGELKHTLTIRGLAALITAGGILFAALHYWPPGHWS